MWCIKKVVKGASSNLFDVRKCIFEIIFGTPRLTQLSQRHCCYITPLVFWLEKKMGEGCQKSELKLLALALIIQFLEHLLLSPLLFYFTRFNLARQCDNEVC